MLKSSDSIRVQGFDVEKVLEIDQDLNGDRDLAAEDEMKEEKKRRWHKMLSRDLYITEAMRILQDMGRS